MKRSSAVSLDTKAQNEYLSRFGFEMGQYVMCMYEDKNLVHKEFGRISDKIGEDYYVVELESTSGFASVPIENITEASRA